MLKTSRIIKSEKFAEAEKLIITLHGYGTSGLDFAEVGKIFLAKKIENAVFLFPDAPKRCEAGFGGYQWFDLDELSHEAMKQGLAKVAPVLKEYIESMSREYNCDNIYLIGFSQGTITAFEMMYHTKISKILAYSGLFVNHSDDLVSKSEVLLVHSSDDPVVPYKNALDARRDLSKLGLTVALESYNNIGHSISLEGWETGIKFLNK